MLCCQIIFLILCAVLQFLYFLRSVHCCLILCCCSHPDSELRDAAHCCHLISLLLCSLQALQLPGATPVLQQQQQQQVLRPQGAVKEDAGVGADVCMWVGNWTWIRDVPSTLS